MIHLELLERDKIKIYLMRQIFNLGKFEKRLKKNGEEKDIYACGGKTAELAGKIWADEKYRM